jgi:hypothetical protein
MPRETEELLAMDPTLLATDEEAKAQLIAYYRTIRENVVALEAQGKPITKKSSKTKQDKPVGIDLSQLVKDS